MQQNQFLLYGANGYTGELIARFASEYNLQPILAGRRKEALKALGAKLNMPYKVFELTDTAALEAALKEVKVVIHCAGPFDHTAKPMADACIKTGVHYLDINGDMDVYELLYAYHEAAKKAGVMMMSGAGFDVVPTDCTALFLKKLLPSATSLQLAFATPGGGLSHGTATTTVQKLGEPGAVRKDDKIIPVPVGHKGIRVDFGGGQKLFVMSLPWGDVFTAYLTTGIPNIESYTAVPWAAYAFLQFQFLFNWLLRTSLVRNIVKKKIDKSPAGLDDSKRNKSTSLVWGKVTDTAGNTRTAALSGPDAYTLTAYCTLLITRKILDGNFTSGYQTPAGEYGEDLIMEIKGVKREVIN
jgi:short subunit dehydrogenase-like uncharacterized protein